ncbi:hypothetical protein COU37_02675 [Candidatus Micrarchaeota archaeon CG10_big_fil_rev_8_21_14_0_10_45_29]|nr:MAG: hypothetical protein COU37_02675 [Candidatus Micrarchaeota archaeon CG10_big_fil_rev_8_21_14_0_10_45_29]
MPEERIKEILELMDLLLEDNSIPKNIRKVVGDAKNSLKMDDEVSTRVSSAVQALVQISEDINMPMHARTQVWTILSGLESIQSE